MICSTELVTNYCIFSQLMKSSNKIGHREIRTTGCCYVTAEFKISQTKLFKNVYQRYLNDIKLNTALLD